MIYDRKQSLNYLLTRILKLRRLKLHSLFNEYGIHPGQHPILFALWEKDGQTQKELADHLIIKPSSLTVNLQRMEKAGLIKKAVDLEDKRISRVYITEKGNSLRVQIEKTLQIVEEECFKDFSEEEKTILKVYFLRIQDNLMKSVDYSFQDNDK
jgi:DNA-binding MarR family transcriptional regulator